VQTVASVFEHGHATLRHLGEDPVAVSGVWFRVLDTRFRF